MSAEVPRTNMCPLLRIATVAPGEIFGGAERQIMTLLRALRRRGLTSQLFTFHDAELAREARAAGIETQVLGARGLFDRESLRLLERSLQKSQPQVLHVHGYRASVYCALAAPARALGIVKTEHGGVEAGGARMRDRLRPLIYRKIDTWAARRMRAHIVFVTRELRAHCLREFPGLRASVIYNGIEALETQAAARPPEYRSEHVNVAIVGRLEPVKGIEYAIRAICQPGMPADVRLHVIGAGPLRSALEQLSVSLGVGHRVRFAGFRRNAYDYIAHADALLMPSLHEGLPYSILEAMVLGTPVLTSRVGGLKEILTHQRTALQFEPANERQIADTVARVAGDPSLRKALADAARADATTRFSAEAMTNQYVELFESLVVVRRPA